jgi:hypothetical protein
MRNMPKRQIDENVACVLVRGVRLNIDDSSFAVANAQKPGHGRARQLVRRPKPLARKHPPGLVLQNVDFLDTSVALFRWC